VRLARKAEEVGLGRGGFESHCLARARPGLPNICNDARVINELAGNLLDWRWGMRQIKIVVEKHPDVYVAYPLGLKGVVIGQGDTYEAALSDVKSAIQFHLESFGPDALEVDPPILEAFVAEAAVTV
jgi:predicted RNase H-like HicB family nuclease